MTTRAWTTVILCAALAGCGYRSDGLARLEELYPTPAPPTEDAGTEPLDLGTPQCAGLTGRWAVRLLQNGTISPLGESWRMVLEDLFLADTTEAGAHLSFCDQASSITTSAGQTDLGRALVPEALKAAVGAHPVDVALPGDGTFAAQDVVWLWGLSGLAHPLTDPLPTKDNYQGDARVVDEDGDGHPGVTMTIVSPAGDRYLVRRSVWTFGRGKLTLDNAWLTGPLASVVSESPLGATNDLLLTAAPITPRTDGSAYQLRCVGTTYTCAALSRDRVRLFRDAPK